MSTTFQGAVHQNKFLAGGATKVNAVVTIKSILAQAAATTMKGTGRVLGFVVDKSGSMDGEKWRAARAALAEAIAILPDDAEFFVILGNDSAQELIGLQKATKANRDAAVTLVRAQNSGGGTYFGQWLSAANRIFKQRPQAIKVLSFLTDGENDGGDTSSRLPAALAEANGLYQVECRGVGTGYRPDQLRAIVAALGGSVDMMTPANMTADFKAIVEKTKGLAMSSVQLQFWTPVGASVKMVKQVAPDLQDLTGKLVPGTNPRIQRLETGAWGEESRDYHVVAELEAASIGQVGGPEKLVARVSLIINEGGTETEVKLNEGGMVKAEWTDDDARSTVINPTVANYTGQAELAKQIQEGVAALNAGDEEKATKALARAAELAEQTGNEEATKRLEKFVETDEKGTKRLKKGISDGDKVELDTKSTKTRRVK